MDATRRCAGPFSAWLAEVRCHVWPCWAAMHGHFPRALPLDDGDTHFPLTEDGTGILTRVEFAPHPFLLVRRISAPPPVAYRFAASPYQTNNHATTAHL